MVSELGIEGKSCYGLFESWWNILKLKIQFVKSYVIRNRTCDLIKSTANFSTQHPRPRNFQFPNKPSYTHARARVYTAHIRENYHFTGTPISFNLSLTLSRMQKKDDKLAHAPRIIRPTHSPRIYISIFIYTYARKATHRVSDFALLRERVSISRSPRISRTNAESPAKVSGTEMTPDR